MSNHDDLHSSPSLLFGIWFDHTTYNAAKKQGTVTKVVSKSLVSNKGSIIYGTDESELILQPHFYFRY
ncbi:hypothetical protein EGP56_13500 [Enterococcus faecium]|nr:hypothetical protein CEQ10_014740 [Enterococcus faecium]RSD81502.1 hypothetical protein EGP56_13500 [Enterococcus faecium]